LKTSLYQQLFSAFMWLDWQQESIWPVIAPYNSFQKFTFGVRPPDTTPQK